MGVYRRGDWYWYRRIVEGVIYRRPLGIRKGQEAFLSARAAQEDEAIVSRHYGTPAPRPGSAKFSEFEKVYLERKASNKSIDRDKQRLPKIRGIIKDLPLAAYGPKHFQRLETALLAEKRSPTTLNRYFQLLRELLLACRRGAAAGREPAPVLALLRRRQDRPGPLAGRAATHPQRTSGHQGESAGARPGDPLRRRRPRHGDRDEVVRSDRAQMVIYTGRPGGHPNQSDKVAPASD